MIADEYLRAYVQTNHFTFGTPRSFTICADGKHVLFLRAETATSPVHKLYELNVETKREKCLIDLADFSKANDSLTEAEQRLRERLREVAQGISHYSTDAQNQMILCLHGSTAIIFGRVSSKTKLVELESGAHSAQLSPDGERLSYVNGDHVWWLDLASGKSVQVTPELEGSSWGVSEFVAAEEMSRYSGMWWSPDSKKLLLTQVDETAVETHYISDPADSTTKPVTMRYPMAGTSNAQVKLYVFDLETGKQHEIKWDQTKFEYLSKVSWRKEFITIKVISRSQKQAQIIYCDPAKNYKSYNKLEQKHSKWLNTHSDIVTWWDDKLVTADYYNGVNCLHLDGKPVATDLNVQAVVGCGEQELYFLANRPDFAEERHVYSFDQKEQIQQLTQGEEYNSAQYNEGLLVLQTYTATTFKKSTKVLQLSSGRSTSVSSNASSLKSNETVHFHKLGKNKAASLVILPHDYNKRSKIPVIVSSYGGPWHQDVIYAQISIAQQIWFAKHGYAVIVCDGRGTPNRNEAWEYSIAGNLAELALEDQASALHEAAKIYPKLDLKQVGIRGWSFGGYLAALAVLQKPEVFKAAVAGAPVTDWRLYDTFYSEKFLGDPHANRSAYEDSSLLTKASNLTKPLLLIHGFQDDNVLVSNSLQLSNALFQSSKSELVQTVLLSNQTHMRSDTDTTTRVMLSELDFFDQHLK